MTRAIAQGRPVPASVLGELCDSTSLAADSAALRSRFDGDGYVFIRRAVGSHVVQDARREVFTRLAEVDEIQVPPEAGIATGRSRRKELAGDLGAFWQSVCEGPALRSATHGDEMRSLMSRILGEPARPHDYIFLRPGVVGRSTHLHYDFPFFARGSQRVCTAWLALGEVPIEEGPLMVLEGSQHFADLIDPVRKIDYESKYSPQVQMTGDTVDFAAARGSRLLTTDFGPGDLIVFSMFTMHGTLDNHSAIGRVRLSCDVRWQPAADPIDPRYIGPNPPGTTGAGYGELNGAKPLTEPWHIR